MWYVKYPKWHYVLTNSVLFEAYDLLATANSTLTMLRYMPEGRKQDFNENVIIMLCSAFGLILYVFGSFLLKNVIY